MIIKHIHVNNYAQNRVPNGKNNFSVNAQLAL